MRIITKNIQTLKRQSGITDNQFKKYMKFTDEEYNDFSSDNYKYNSLDIEKLSNLFMVDEYDLIDRELNEYKSYKFNENFNDEDINNLSNLNKIVKNQIFMDNIIKKRQL